MYHLGIGKNLSRSNLAKANERRDYRIFEDFVYYMIAEARRKRATKMFDLEGNVYAFDSTTIDLCMSLFEWAKFRKKKGGIKVHTLFDVEACVPTFAYIKEAKVHDAIAMDAIPYEAGSYYIFDRGYNDFKRLHASTLSVLLLLCEPRKTSNISVCLGNGNYNIMCCPTV